MSVTEIADTQDPVLRNLLITQRYHDFAVALRDGGAGEDATWCAFAVWASKTAGATIRGEVLPVRARELFEQHDKASGGVRGAVQPHGRGHGAQAGSRTTTWPRWRESVTADVSKSIADGNQLVFAELAPLFTVLLDARASSPEPSRDALHRRAPSRALLARGIQGCRRCRRRLPRLRRRPVLPRRARAHRSPGERARGGPRAAAPATEDRRCPERRRHRHHQEGDRGGRRPPRADRGGAPAARRGDRRGVPGHGQGVGHGPDRDHHAAGDQDRDLRPARERPTASRRDVPARAEDPHRD